MTLDEFLAALRQTPRDWHLTPSRFRSGTAIRRKEFGYLEQCPMIAVAVLGQDLSVDRWAEAAFALRIDDRLAKKIVNAADSSRGSLRAQLLEACGLS